jgi:hypothetical protein
LQNRRAREEEERGMENMNQEDSITTPRTKPGGIQSTQLSTPVE